MTSPRFDGPATATSDLYRALLAVSEAIASHRDLPALFHELAGRLHPVVRFDNLALLLHEAEGNTLRLHVLERLGPTWYSEGRAEATATSSPCQLRENAVVHFQLHRP